MKILYFAGPHAEKDKALLRSYGHLVLEGALSDYMTVLEDSVFVVRGGKLALSRKLIDLFLSRPLAHYAYSDLKHAGHFEVTLEFLPESLIRQIKAYKGILLPNGNLDMQYARDMEIVNIPDDILSELVQLNLDDYAYPTGISLDPCGVCNLKCEMCNFQTIHPPDRLLPPTVMPLEFFQRMANEIAQWPTKPNIEFAFRGEPLLNKHLFEGVKAFSDVGCHTCLITNGLLLDDKALNKLLTSGLKSLVFSIDALDKETYEKIRRGGSFELLIKNINRAVKVLRKHAPAMVLQLRMVKQDANRADWEEIFRQYENVVDMVGLQNQVVVDQAGVHRCHHRFVDEPGTREFCILPWTYMAMTSSGDVYPCGVIDENNREEILGSFQRAGLLEIWNSSKFRALREQMQGLKTTAPFSCSHCSKEACSSKLVYQTVRGHIFDRIHDSHRSTSHISGAPKSGGSWIHRIKELVSR